jgi:hypothetical protein
MEKNDATKYWPHRLFTIRIVINVVLMIFSLFINYVYVYVSIEDVAAGSESDKGLAWTKCLYIGFSEVVVMYYIVISGLVTLLSMCAIVYAVGRVNYRNSVFLSASMIAFAMVSLAFIQLSIPFVVCS